MTGNPLARAIVIAAQAHETQTDKAGAVYILHPLRLMNRADTPDARIVAVLHDVVEDSNWTLEQLQAEGFSSEVIVAVGLLTHRENESYDSFVQRIVDAEGAAGKTARHVKLLDIEDNMDMTRLSTLSTKDWERMNRYHTARQQIKEAIERDTAQAAQTT